MTPPRIMPMVAMIFFRIPRPKNARARPRTTKMPAIARTRLGSRFSIAILGCNHFAGSIRMRRRKTSWPHSTSPHLHRGQNIFMAPRSFSWHGRKSEAFDGGGAEDGRDVVDRGIWVRDRPDVEHRGAIRIRNCGDSARYHREGRRVGGLGVFRRQRPRHHRRDGHLHRGAEPRRRQGTEELVGESLVPGEALLSPARDGLRPMKVMVLDGCVDEPSNFGVPVTATVRGPMQAVRAMHHHCTRYSQWSSPDRAHRVLVTVPATPRAFRIPS